MIETKQHTLQREKCKQLTIAIIRIRKKEEKIEKTMLAIWCTWISLLCFLKAKKRQLFSHMCFIFILISLQKFTKNVSLICVINACVNRACVEKLKWDDERKLKNLTHPCARWISMISIGINNEFMMTIGKLRTLLTSRQWWLIYWSIDDCQL